MAHEELKKQYEEDVKKYGKDAYELWEYKSKIDGCWLVCSPNGPEWRIGVVYRRKEPHFKPEYFSGLNWRDAEKLVGKVVEFSDEPECGWWSGRLVEIFTATTKKFNGEFKCKRGEGLIPYEYIRTGPETYAHPTITIGGVELPRPEVDAPAKGTKYFYLGPMMRVYRSVWHNTPQERIGLERGLINLTEARAQAWANWWENTVMAAVKK